ncbi:hypothetical protein GQ457_02G014500 [Hibiscus cannabinus]
MLRQWKESLNSKKNISLLKIKEISAIVAHKNSPNKSAFLTQKSKLFRDQREYIRFRNMKRNKYFVCFERVKNILEGIDLHTIFSAAEQKRIIDCEMEDPAVFPQQYQMMNSIDSSFHDMSFPKIIHATHISTVWLELLHYRKVHHTFFFFTVVFPYHPFYNSKSSSTVISRQFYDVKPKNEVRNYWDGNMGCKEQYHSNKSGQISRSRTPLHAQDHVITERKRREKLNHSFISLSTLILGLKRISIIKIKKHVWITCLTDNASVLGDGVRQRRNQDLDLEYLKQLQDRVNVLEKQVANKITESMIFVKKTQIYADDENFNGNAFPEIEARISDKDVLINLLPFGQATLDITFAARMEAGFSMTVKDLVKSLRVALLK